MKKATAVEMEPGHEVIVMVLLTHKRLVNLKRQFLDEVNKLLANPQALIKLAETAKVNRDELSSKGRELVAILSAGPRPNQAALQEFGGVVSSFCLSAALLSFWGHFTATLSKLTSDDVFINDVAASCGHGSADDVRAAIRQFGDLKRMPAGKAGM